MTDVFPGPAAGQDGHGGADDEPDDRDPQFTAINMRRYPIEDPPVCERRGCGHLMGLHDYDQAADAHGACRGCPCREPLHPAPPQRELTG